MPQLADERGIGPGYMARRPGLALPSAGALAIWAKRTLIPVALIVSTDPEGPTSRAWAARYSNNPEKNSVVAN